VEKLQHINSPHIWYECGTAQSNVSTSVVSLRTILTT